MYKDSQTTKASPSPSTSIFPAFTPSRHNPGETEGIFSSEYVMEKRGKTFGHKEYRRFAIKENKLYQLSSLLTDPECKQLPLPSATHTELREHSKVWSEECSNFNARLFLEFSQRSAVYVYFASIQECERMRACLLSLSLMENGVDLSKYSSPFKAAIVDQIISRLQRMAGVYRQEKQEPQGVINPKSKAIAAFMGLNQLTRHPVFLIEEWATKAELEYQRQPLSLLQVKVDNVKAPMQLKLNNPLVKLWILNEGRQLPALIKQSEQKESITFVSTSDAYSQINGCSLDQELQLEVGEGIKKWKSERMKLVDLVRLGKRLLTIALSSTQPYPTVLLNIKISQEIVEYFETQAPSLEFNPNNYSVIEEIIGSQYSDNLQTNHELHRASLSKYLERQAEEVQFYRLKRYIQILDIQAVIQKSYTNEPAFRNLGTEYRGTVIYSYYVNVTRDTKYYDVEKLLLEHGDFHRRRFLNALKRFDNAYRINFTSKLYYLIDKVISLVNSAPTAYWNHSLFRHNYMGRESAAFFIVIVLIFDIAPNYYLNGGKGLPNNSLLMHYTTKLHLNSLYLKLNKLELNVETLFGVYSVSLMAELIQGEAFYKVLDAVILEAKSKKYDFNLTLIGLFLSILSRLQKYQSPFESPENFIFGLKVMSAHVVDQYQFCYEGDLFIEKMKKVFIENSFLQIFNEMKALSRSQGDEDTSGAMIQFFTQFPENQQKTERGYREMHFCINKIEINAECPKLMVYLFQNKVKIFQQQLLNSKIREMKVNFGIKLDSLNDVVLAVYQDQKLYTEFCLINPRKLPSNYMFQMCLPLERKKGMVDEPQSFICFQVIIREESPSQIFQAKVPEKYANFFLEADTHKTQLSELIKFSGLFRMSPNNYNSLYSKLGWYNNHSIFPEERLLSIHRVENNEVLQLDEKDLGEYYKLNKFSRCAFGRAIVFSKDRNLFIQVVKNGIQFGSTYKVDLESSKHQLVSNQLACYTLENVKAFNPTYLQFFNNAMDLPLIDYLTYNPQEYDILPDLTFSITLGDIKSTVVFSSGSGEGFVVFNQTRAQEIENTITFRRLRLKSKYVLNFPSICTCLDNFLYQLKLNILADVIRSESSNSKILTKWPSHIIIKANELTTPLNNMPLGRFFVLVYQTKYNIVMEFVDQGKPRLKGTNGLCFLKFFNDWKRVEVLCQVSSSQRYYLVEEQLSRRKLLVREEDVIALTEMPRMKISCEEGELWETSSQLYKKIQKLF